MRLLDIADRNHRSVRLPPLRDDGRFAAMRAVEQLGPVHPGLFRSGAMRLHGDLDADPTVCTVSLQARGDDVRAGSPDGASAAM